MESKNTQQESIVATTLRDKGVFAISDIVDKGDFSREGVGKTLKNLVDKGSLKKTATRGAHVRYKLTTSDAGVVFLFHYLDRMTIDDFARAWDVSVASAKKYIKKFVDSGVIDKSGLPPQKIIYTARQKVSMVFLPEQEKVIEKYYAHTTPDGQLLRGVRGFVYWAEHRSGRADMQKLPQEYIDVRNTFYKNQKKVWLIDATDKLQHVFDDEVYIEKLFHRDFDALPVFGKTYLSQLVRIAKSGRTNTALMMEIVDSIQGSINHIVAEHGIDCVGFIPPTVARRTQLMTFIAQRLDIACERIIISKAQSFVPVQQKSLKKIEDRILNARETIVVDDVSQYENVLLIDDVTGSGATLNETARKIIQKGIAQKVYAFTITGSAKAGKFEVISEA